MLNFSLSKNIKFVELNPTGQNGFDKFKSVLDEFYMNSESILEIGGGSSPTYSPSSMSASFILETVLGLLSD